jgi:hypothetical protein
MVHSLSQQGSACEWRIELREGSLCLFGGWELQTYEGVLSAGGAGGGGRGLKDSVSSRVVMEDWGAGEAATSVKKEAHNKPSESPG